MRVVGTPPVHRALVARLVADAQPVARLWPPAPRLAAWLGLALAVVALAGVVGLRPDVRTELARPLYVAQVTALLAGATLFAAAALRAAVPGLGANRALVGAALALTAAGVALAWWMPAVDSHATVFGPRCALCVVLFGALPGVALFVAVRRGAPFHARATAAWAGSAALLVGAAAVRLACPVDEPLHLLGWHVVPVAVGGVLSAVAGSTWLARWCEV